MKSDAIISDVKRLMRRFKWENSVLVTFWGFDHSLFAYLLDTDVLTFYFWPLHSLFLI